MNRVVLGRMTVRVDFPPPSEFHLLHHLHRAYPDLHDWLAGQDGAWRLETVRDPDPAAQDQAFSDEEIHRLVVVFADERDAIHCRLRLD